MEGSYQSPSMDRGPQDQGPVQCPGAVCWWVLRGLPLDYCPILASSQ